MKNSIIFFLLSGLLFSGCADRPSSGIRGSRQEKNHPPEASIEAVKEKETISLTIAPESYPVSACKIKAKLVSRTDERVETGTRYTIEYFDKGAWVPVPLPENFGFHDLLYVLESPGEQTDSTVLDLELYLYDKPGGYEPGKYRIRKTVRTATGTRELTAEFRLEPTNLP